MTLSNVTHVIWKVLPQGSHSHLGSWGQLRTKAVVASKGQITHLKTNRSIFLKLKCNDIHIKATFLNKNFERLRDPLQVFFAKILQKMNFFQIFLHIWNQLDELVRKMVLIFQFDQFLIMAFFGWNGQILTTSFWPYFIRKHIVSNKNLLLRLSESITEFWGFLISTGSHSAMYYRKAKFWAIYIFLL